MSIATPARRNSRVRHPNRHPQTREQAFDWLAAQFTHITSAEMRAAELAFGPETPVADRMRETVR